MLQVGLPKLAVLFTFICFGHCSFGQCNYTIKGAVEENTGEPLPGATVFIEAQQQGVATDISGNFMLTNLCPGTVSILIKFVGFEDQLITVKVPTIKSIVVKLKPSVKLLHDITIEAQHAQKHSITQSSSILSDEQIIAEKGKPLGAMIQQLPGVQTIRSTS